MISSIISEQYINCTEIKKKKIIYMYFFYFCLPNQFPQKFIPQKCSIVKPWLTNNAKCKIIKLNEWLLLILFNGPDYLTWTNNEQLHFLLDNIN